MHVADREQGFGDIYTSIYYCWKSFPVLLHDVAMVGGWIASYVFISILWSRCCCCCYVLLLLPTTSVLKRREVPPTASSFSVSATAIITFLCVYSIVVAAVEKGYAFIFFVEVLLLTTSVLKQREVPATVSSFYVSVLDTAMLRTSIAAVVLGCFYSVL